MKPATLLKVTLLNGRFSRFLNCIDGSDSRNESHIYLKMRILKSHFVLGGMRSHIDMHTHICQV